MEIWIFKRTLCILCLAIYSTLNEATLEVIMYVCPSVSLSLSFTFFVYCPIPAYMSHMILMLGHIYQRLSWLYLTQYIVFPYTINGILVGVHLLQHKLPFLTFVNRFISVIIGDVHKFIVIVLSLDLQSFSLDTLIDCLSFYIYLIQWQIENIH